MSKKPLHTEDSQDSSSGEYRISSHSRVWSHVQAERVFLVMPSMLNVYSTPSALPLFLHPNRVLLNNPTQVNQDNKELVRVSRPVVVVAVVDRARGSQSDKSGLQRSVDDVSLLLWCIEWESSYASHL